MSDELSGKLVADKYRIGELIGEEETGDLYTARHDVLDRPLTIKVLPRALAVDERWVKRFVEEARRASAVAHQNVLNITDFGTDARGISYAVFEPVPETTLADAIGSSAPLDQKRALTIAQRIADGVAAAHDKRVIHGALSPASVFVSEADEVKVYGFGSDPMTVRRGADHRFLAPEQCSAFPSADERSDIYAVGAILYQMLSGEVPFEGATAADVLAKQNSEPPAPLSAFRQDLQPDVEPMILAAMAADPDKRYQTMKALAEDLSRLSGTSTTGAAAVASAARGRNIWQTAFFVLAGIGLLSAVLIYATSGRKTDVTAATEVEDTGLPVQPIGPATGAQEESLAKLPAMTEAEILAATMGQNADMLPGGDGYNAWANGGIPPAGAPLGAPLAAPLGAAPPVGYVPPGGQVYTIDPNGGSQFMPNEGGVILVPVPVTNTNTAPAPSPTQKSTTPADPSIEPKPAAGVTPKPLATPPGKGKAGSTDKTKAPAAKPTPGNQPRPE